MHSLSDDPYILVAEDDNDDFFILQKVFHKYCATAKVRRVHDGEELSQHLEANDAPTMIVLDLNMPKRDGREALKDISTDPRLKSIPVVVLTTSNSKSDKDFVIGHRALFFTKPYSMSEYFEFGQLIRRYIDKDVPEDDS